MSTTESTFTPLTIDELTMIRDILGIPERNAIVASMNQTEETIKAINTMIAEMKSKDSNIQDMMIALGHQNNALNKFADSISDLAKSVTTSHQNQTIAINKLIESNKIMSDTIAKAIYVNAAKTEKAFSSIAKPTDVNGLFYSTYPEENKTMWIQKIKGDICSKCLESNSSDTGEFFNTLYSDMKQHDHYDVPALLAEYKKIDPTADELKMCANSDALRLSVEKRINNIYHKRIVDKKSNTNNIIPKNKTSFSEYRRCPADIKSLIKKITRSNRPSGVQYKKILDAILSETGLTKTEIIDDVCRDLVASNCNVWYAVSKFPTLVNALQKLAEED